jgi:hypothetical protein
MTDDGDDDDDDEYAYTVFFRLWLVIITQKEKHLNINSAVGNVWLLYKQQVFISITSDAI